MRDLGSPIYVLGSHVSVLGSSMPVLGLKVEREESVI